MDQPARATMTPTRLASSPRRLLVGLAATALVAGALAWVSIRRAPTMTRRAT